MARGPALRPPANSTIKLRIFEMPQSRMARGPALRPRNVPHICLRHYDAIQEIRRSVVAKRHRQSAGFLTRIGMTQLRHTFRDTASNNVQRRHIVAYRGKRAAEVQGMSLKIRRHENVISNSPRQQRLLTPWRARTTACTSRGSRDRCCPEATWRHRSETSRE